ncbi:hypothetical protein EWH99_02980 [Sporolactobacillus sp. THM7-7]|nr:hypothetical protein EWH99_02980 [Sporolactobacillus sp. THM7-7]
MRRTIHAVVASKTSVLGRVSAVLSKYNLSIETLALTRKSDENGLSILRLIADVENRRQADQLIKQLNKLIDVVTAADVTERQEAGENVRI